MLRTICLSSLLLVPCFAQSVRIEFELLPSIYGTLDPTYAIPNRAPADFASQTAQVTDEYVVLGVRFSPSPAVEDTNEVLDASSLTTTPGHSSPNVLASSGNRTIEARFTVPVERVRALIGIADGADELEIFDAAGNSLGAVIGDDADVELTSPTPITRFVVRASSGGTPMIDNLEFDVVPGPIGAAYCAPAVPNSSGASGTTTATGSSLILHNDVTLVASSLPLHSFGYFILSRTQANIQHPGGSQGTLCLGGGIGRLSGPGQVKNSGATGTFDLRLDLNTIPTPHGIVRTLAGDEWHFQAWHRDSVGGFATSNFTSAVTIQF